MLPMRKIFSRWYPLAFSWLLMAAELPAISIVVARLDNPEVHLAAYGGLVFQLALIIEAPVIMLLAASTALSKDWDSYRKLRKFMHTTSASITLLHVLIAFTPLYDLIVVSIIQVPAEIVEPGRIGLRIMVPWTWAIAYRRFNQGVLIRFNRSLSVGVGTIIRLSADVLVLAIGLITQAFPGVVVATTAVIAGVVAEAAYAGIAVRPVVKHDLPNAPPVPEPLTVRSFLEFYIPLALTSLLTLLANPIGSAALSRMPEALSSLAAWPVVAGMVFIFRSTGMAFNEVVVALLDEPNAVRSLRRFAALLSAFLTILLLVIIATPLSDLWLRDVSALRPHLVSLAEIALWLALPIPALNVVQSWFQGALVHEKRTRGITEAVVIYLVTNAGLLFIAATWDLTVGIYAGMGAMTISVFAQTLWLWKRSRPAIAQVTRRDDLAMEGQAVHGGAS